MATTEENLNEAFAGESRANRKYLAFAKKADDDGFPEVARLFRAAAEAETVHAMAHLRQLKAVKSTAENLEAARAGETYEYAEMYPPMVEVAEAENSPAALTFRYALAAEERHASLYAKALEAVKAGRDVETGGVYVCPVCGNVVFGKPTAPCEICSTAADKFVEIQ
ncbi:MAG: rubrerythrin family protein [candidate division Zixibacteria bacterium]|nr:rubrerythrin family protein [candidate division Zixibacteria bacterium]